MTTVDMIKSVEIYNELMNGRMINRQIVSEEGEFIPNPLFTEVMDNVRAYTQQYAMSGHTIEYNTDYLYLFRGQAHETSKTELSMKAYILLVVIGHYVNTQGFVTTSDRSSSKLSAINGGLTLADIDKIQETPVMKEMLERADMKGDLYKTIKSIMIDRNIMHRHPITQNIILSGAGTHFYDELTRNYKSEIELLHPAEADAHA